ncbi:hypothetical protein [Flavobacterium sp. SLB02]|uniref:hypothetical protein n=1 Tax=Flavobacterium sp. SLB02 TaxID=2665645 RepID=UPI0012A9C46B|nr:hypothetical protein [Flavobacterium sp. SLB02]QGK75032.1 hypothetical protein GIY83_13415 [Flavobacterium sp. SLB02]
MNGSELISFFNERCKLTDFEIRRKIYDLTNNLDIDLLYDLIEEYGTYVSCLKRKINLANGIDESNIYPAKHRLWTITRKQIYIDTHLKENIQTDVKEVEKERDYFLQIVRDLALRKISGMPKNSRQRNNSRFEWFIDEILDSNTDMYGYHDENLQKDDEITDLSDTTITAKIIYLEKLGIINYLRTQKPFSTSINSIATVLSAVTGAKVTSIQPLLNPLLGKDTHNKNNPLNSVKNVLSIEKTLINMGFEVK